MDSSAKWTLLNGSEKWSKGALFQGQRLLSTHQEIKQIESRLLFVPNPKLEDIAYVQELSDIEKCEEEFFVYALHNAIFFLQKTSDLFSGFRTIVDEIENVNGKGIVKDVRDMRVHVDDYSKKKGREQERFICKSPDGLFSADATSSFIFQNACQNDYLIGGRINVQKSIQVLQKLVPIIIDKCKEQIRLLDEEEDLTT